MPKGKKLAFKNSARNSSFKFLRNLQFKKRKKRGKRNAKAKV